MAWTNTDVHLYHGCLESAAQAIARARPPRCHSVDLRRCSRFTDFGRGFYLTSRLDQAQNWANEAARRALAGTTGAAAPTAAVLEVVFDRETLGALVSMGFVIEGPATGEYWSLVRHCRAGGDHVRSGPEPHYDLVCGPVALPRQRLTVANCDQFALHTKAALDAPARVTIHSVGTPLFP